MDLPRYTAPSCVQSKPRAIACGPEFSGAYGVGIRVGAVHLDDEVLGTIMGHEITVQSEIRVQKGLEALDIHRF